MCSTEPSLAKSAFFSGIFFIASHIVRISARAYFRIIHISLHSAKELENYIDIFSAVSKAWTEHNQIASSHHYRMRKNAFNRLILADSERSLAIIEVDFHGLCCCTLFFAEFFLRYVSVYVYVQIVSTFEFQRGSIHCMIALECSENWFHFRRDLIPFDIIFSHWQNVPHRFLLEFQANVWCFLRKSANSFH